MLTVILSALCDPWRVHWGLLLAIFVIGSWAGVFIALQLRWWAEDQARAEAAHRDVKPQDAPPSPKAWEELDETVVRPPPAERRAPKGGRR